MTLLCAAAPARAQTLPQTDSLPLSAGADGVGALTLSMYGSTEFDTRPVAAGLQIWSKQFAGDARQKLAGPTLSADRQSLTSRYTIAKTLDVTETVTAINAESDTSRARVTYAIKNTGDAAVSFSAAELANLVSPIDDRAQGVLAQGFVGGLDRIGRQVGLEAVTPFDHVQAGPPSVLYENFLTGKALDGSASQDFGDLAVGAQWDVAGLQPGATKEISVVWRVPMYTSDL